MSSTAVDENVVKLTLETLGKVIKQVPLTEKLLSRPPFKFIHDIIKEVSIATNFQPVYQLARPISSLFDIRFSNSLFGLKFK